MDCWNFLCNFHEFISASIKWLQNKSKAFLIVQFHTGFCTFVMIPNHNDLQIVRFRCVCWPQYGLWCRFQLSADAGFFFLPSPDNLVVATISTFQLCSRLLTILGIFLLVLGCPCTVSVGHRGIFSKGVVVFLQSSTFQSDQDIHMRTFPWEKFFLVSLPSVPICIVDIADARANS